MGRKNTNTHIHMEMSRLTRDGTAEPSSRDQILTRERGQGSIHFPRSADHKQDRQLFPADPYSSFLFDHIYRDSGMYHFQNFYLKELLIVQNSTGVPGRYYKFLVYCNRVPKCTHTLSDRQM